MPYALRPEILNPYKKKPPYRPISEATLAASVSKSWPTCAAFFIWLVVYLESLSGSFAGVSYYIGDSKRDPSLENYPYIGLEFRVQAFRVDAFGSTV